MPKTTNIRTIKIRITTGVTYLLAFKSLLRDDDADNRIEFLFSPLTVE
jgi:hypothetical protein